MKNTNSSPSVLHPFTVPRRWQEILWYSTAERYFHRRHLLFQRNTSRRESATCTKWPYFSLLFLQIGFYCSKIYPDTFTDAIGVMCSAEFGPRSHVYDTHESAEMLMYKIAVLSFSARVLLETNTLNATEVWKSSGLPLNQSKNQPSWPGNFSNLEYASTFANISNIATLNDQLLCLDDFDDQRDKPQKTKSEDSPESPTSYESGGKELEGMSGHLFLIRSASKQNYKTALANCSNFL